ncbi:MAG: hypothetical protein ACJ76H_04960 [Bacteriovoracaceae bacterium]
MKRIILLTLISAAFIYHLLPEPESTSQIDQIKVRMAANRHQPAAPEAAVHRITAALVQDNTQNEIETVAVSDEAVTSEIEPNEVAQTDEMPLDELKQGWRSDLKEYLVEVDPDNGEEIYTSYMEEADSYEAEIDALAKEADKAGKESKQDFETLIGQLEVKHEEKLKEILGSHYSDVTDRHQQYNNSLQYMNPSETEPLVGVSL